MSADLAIASFTEDEARRLTERIRLTAHTFAESRSKLIALVDEAKAGNAHVALGYASWNAYLSDVLSDEPLRLARDDRKELVGILTSEGMSTRDIAPIVGASQRTVANDVSQVSNFAHLEREVSGHDGKTYTVTPKPDVIRVDQNTGEVLDATQRTPRATRNQPDAALSLVNDVRLYLRAMASSPEVAQLSITAKGHILSALQEAIDTLKGTGA